MELICLSCGQSNPADAKFCSQCGAALLRRFCEQCHAVNDAEAHFCRSCGAALPQQLLPATSAPVPGDLGPLARARQSRSVFFPTLDQVVASDEAGGVAATAPESLHGQDPDPVAESPSGDGAPQVVRPAHRTALLVVGGLVVLMVIIALWSRAPRTDVRPRDADTTRGAPSANVSPKEQPPPLPTPPAATTAAGNETVDGSPPDTSGAVKSGQPAAEALPAPFDPARPDTPPRRPVPANRPSRGTATPAPSPLPAPSPSPAPAPAAAPECTRQADALALCPPGATITGR